MYSMPVVASPTLTLAGAPPTAKSRTQQQQDRFVQNVSDRSQLQSTPDVPPKPKRRPKPLTRPSPWPKPQQPTAAAMETGTLASEAKERPMAPPRQPRPANLAPKDPVITAHSETHHAAEPQVPSSTTTWRPEVPPRTTSLNRSSTPLLQGQQAQQLQQVRLVPTPSHAQRFRQFCALRVSAPLQRAWQATREACHHAMARLSRALRTRQA